jgi:hypothetical protein
MATEKTLFTRIGLKVDTLENWKSSSLILKKGEVAFATVAATAGSNLSEPVVMMKIGDGEKTFSQLGFDFYAKASDVLEAAKDASKLTLFIEKVIQDAGLASNATVTALSNKVNGIETAVNTLNGNAETEGSVAKKIADAIAALDLANSYDSKGSASAALAAAKKYSDDLAVNYEVAGAAATAEANAKAYADGLASNYDAAGAAAAVQSKLDEYKSTANAAIAEAKKAGTDAAALAETKVTMTEVEQKGYATTTYVDTEVKKATDAADAAQEAADKVADDLDEYKTTANAAIALKADKTALKEEVDRATAAEEALDTRLVEVEAFFKTAEGETLDTALDTLKEIQDYITSEGTAADEMVKNIAANATAIATNTAAIATNAGNITKNATAIETEKGRAEAAEKALSDRLDDVVDGTETVAKATHAVDADNATKLNGLAAEKYALVETVNTQIAGVQSNANKAAEDALTAAKKYAEDHVAGQLENYYDKTAADGKFRTEAQVEAAITSAINAQNLTTKLSEVQKAAKDYTDEAIEAAAENYATAAQGKKADTALQEIKAGTGLKVTGKDTVDIDTAVVFVFDCGGASEHTVQA